MKFTICTDVKEVFSLFDRDNDGAIMSKEVICVLRSVGYNPTEIEVKDLLDIYDAEGNMRDFGIEAGRGAKGEWELLEYTEVFMTRS